MIEKDIKVIISAVDQYSKEMAGFAGSWGTVAKAVTAVSVAIMAASAAAATFAINMGKDLFQSATEFHDAIYEVEAVASSFGTTSAEIGTILEDLVIKFPLTGEKAGELMKTIAQMGYGAKESLEGVANAAQTLAIATNTDVVTAAEAAISAMNTYGMSIEEVDRVTNLYAATAFSSAANVNDLREAMKYAAPVAAMAGWSIEGTAAAVAKLKDKGFEASQSGTILRMGLSQLFNETEKGAVSLAKYGLTYEDVNPEVMSMSEIIGAFGGQTIKASDAVKIFGVRAAGLSLVINDGQHAFEAYEEEITGTNAAMEAFEKKLEKWSTIVQMVEGDMDALKNAIGSELVPVIAQFVGRNAEEGLRGVITQLNVLEKENSKLFKPMQDLFEAIKEKLEEAFGESLGTVENLYEWLGKMVELLSANLKILGIWGVELVKVFIEGSDRAGTFELLMHSVNLAIAAIALPVALVHDGFAILFNMIGRGVDLVQSVWTAFMVMFHGGMADMLQLLDALPFLDLKMEIKEAEKAAGEWFKKSKEAWNFEPVKMWTDNVLKATGEVSLAIQKHGEELDEVAIKHNDIAKAAGLTAKELEGLGEDYVVVGNKLKHASEVTIKWAEDTKVQALIVKDVNKELDETEQNFEAILKIRKELSIEDDKHLKNLENSGSVVKNLGDGYALIDGTVTQISKSFEELQKDMEDSAKETKKVEKSLGGANKEMGKFEKSAEKAEEKLSEMEKFELKMDMKEFENDLEIARQKVVNKFELDKIQITLAAEVNTKAIEAQLEKVKRMFDSVDASIASTAATITSLVSALVGGAAKMQERMMLRDVLRDENKRREKSFELQEKLIKQQIKMNDLKIQRLRSGESLISITAEGLEPEIEAFMWQILKKIQIRANEEASEFLLGIQTT